MQPLQLYRNLTERFDYSFLNFILRGMFESKIRQTVCKAAAQMTANMISQMDRVIVT